MIPHNYFEKVKQHYNGDEKKAWEWFNTPHPRLGVMTPLALCKMRRESKVKEVIDELTL